jgi:hypothetical protein
MSGSSTSMIQSKISGQTDDKNKSILKNISLYGNDVTGRNFFGQLQFEVQKKFFLTIPEAVENNSQNKIYSILT